MHSSRRGAAALDDFELRDGVVDVGVVTPASRGFFGIQFRIADDGANAEWVYLRQHKSGLPDAMQYTPVLNTGVNWQIYNGPGFSGAVEIPKDVSFDLRLEVVGAQAKLYVTDMDKPALVMNELKSGVRKGHVALASLTGAVCFSNFDIRTTPEAAWERPSGFVLVNRFRDNAHPKVSFANDFSKRLEPQPGMKAVYARASIHSDRDQTKMLRIGYRESACL